ncbi:membrane-spanning 4-domains subfamily A member 15-like [Anolis sagrei]|uniref:membrane-spanning 4-domains subfamily A member 15-like n=1 Tax=Anolis sagrei TaxID=38937 RepID=UPI003520D560
MVQPDTLAVADLRDLLRMPSGTVVFLPPNGANVYQAAQGAPGTTIIQAPGTVQYVQYGGQQLGTSSNSSQQDPQVGLLQNFLKAEAKTLGAIQIFIGLMHIILGAISATFPASNYIFLVVYTGYVFWGAVFFIISGSLSVSAEKRLTPGLVKCSVGMNITSAIITIAGIILLILELAINSTMPDSDESTNLVYYYWIQSVGAGISSLLLLLSLLEFSITVSVAHFGCQAACCYKDQQPVVFVPYAVNGGVVAPSEGLSPPPPPAYTVADPSPK